MYADELKRKREKIKALQELKKTRSEEKKVATDKRLSSSLQLRQKKDISIDEIENEFGLKKKETVEIGTNTEEEAPSAPPKEVILSVVQQGNLSIEPALPLVYTKSSQTDSCSSISGGNNYYTISYDEREEDEFALDYKNHRSNSILPPGVLLPGIPNAEFVPPAMTDIDLEQKPKDEVQVKELSEDQKLQIILSEDFQVFIYKAGKLMERVLSESVDIFTDYIGNKDNDMLSQLNAPLSLNRSFYCNRWCKNRCVTSIDWSPHFPELMVASYNNNEENPREPGGIVAVWNHKFKKETPEDVFEYSSPIMTVCFAKFQHNLILGGTYSGQIVVWDNRGPRRTPIQRSPLSSIAHTHPIYSLEIVGTQHAHNVISISSDGRLCIWSLDNLSKPLDVIILNDTLKEMKAIVITCMEFIEEEVNNFVIGTECGNIYSASLHGNHTGIKSKYKRHFGNVTGISAHRSFDFRHLFLTSSVDWTIKLWSLKDEHPIYTFDHHTDYAMDVAWSPINPALFASVDASGKLDLWNLNQNIELPIATVLISGAPGLNRLTWAPTGTQITIGDEAGKIYVYDVAENIAQPRVDEWARFETTVEHILGLITTAETVDDEVCDVMSPKTPKTPPPSLLDINEFFRSISPAPPAIAVELIE